MKLRALFGSGLLSLLLPLTAQASDTPAPISVTEGGSRVTALSVGLVHTCALKADGAVDCWGSDTYDQVNSAPGQQTTGTHAGPYLSVSAGALHTCAVKADGAVDCWGNDVTGQVDPAGGEQATGTQAGPYLSVTAGENHTCAVKAGGAVDCWGSDTYDQVNSAAGQQTTGTHAGPYLSVSVGKLHTCGVKADGAVDCWGNDTYDQVNSAINYQTTGSHAGPYLSVSAGILHTCAVKVDGAVDCWGDDVTGQVDPAFGSQRTGTHAGPYLSVTAGYFHTCALKADGAVDCWGGDSYGQAGTHAGQYLSVTAGYYHTCAVRADGAVQCWGAGGEGTSGGVNAGQSTVPAELAAAGSAAFGQIAAGNAHACQVNRDGTLSCWGNNDEGQATPPAGLFTQVVAGDSHSCAVGTDGKVTCWGRNGAGNTTALNPSGSSLFPYRQLAPGPDGAICALQARFPDARCRRGVGSTGMDVSGLTSRNITHSLDNVVYAALCAVMTDGTGFCSRGFDSSHNSYFPGSWQRLESGLSHQCGLSSNGTIECWGASADEQMTGMPGPLDKFRTFSVGWNHACAIRENGQLKCWGSNINGQATPRTGTYVQVAAGNTFTCAIRSDGLRVCWGDDSQGQAPNLRLVPTSVDDGFVGVAHTGATFVLGDFGQNADGGYLPPTPAFAVVDGVLPAGMSLSPNGVLGGTPTASGSFTFTVEGEDANGFMATRAYAVTVIADSTPPVISYALTPATPDGNNGWYVGDVDIAWSVVDAESSFTSTGCTASTQNTDTAAATYTCSATSAGGTSSVTTAIIKRDGTAPTLAPTVPSPILRDGSYAASPNASDALSGLASASCGLLDTTSTGNKTVTCTASDNAGNTKWVDLTYTVRTTCSNDGYTGTKLNWCQNVCENGLSGKVLDTWIHRWVNRYRDLPYCRIGD